MTVSLHGFPVIRFNNPHHPLPSSVLPCSNNNLPRRILPILLLSFLSSTLPVASAQGGLHIDPLVSLPQQCGSFTFAWSGGVPPYTFRITTADSDPTTLRDPFGDDNGTENTTYTWDPVDIQGGTSLLAEVKDSNHQKASDPFMIQSSGDGSCLGTNSSASSTTSSTSTGDSASATSSTPIPSLSSSSTPTPSSPSSSSSQTSSDRLSTGAIAGIVVGLAILILLAVGAFFYFRRRRRAVRGAAGLLGGAKYRAARSSAGTSTKSIEPPVTFWNANLFVREKTATTQQA